MAAFKTDATTGTNFSGTTVANKTAKKTSDYVDKAIVTATTTAPDVNTTSGKSTKNKNLGGVPRGPAIPTKIKLQGRGEILTVTDEGQYAKWTENTSGSANLYTVDSPEKIWATWTAQTAANVRSLMASIPGLYPKGKTPQIATGAYNNYDFQALGKVMSYANVNGMLDDEAGPAWSKALNLFRTQPQVAMDYFRVTPEKEKKGPSLTPEAVANSDLSMIFQAAFNGKPTPAEMLIYKNALNALEAKQGGQTSDAQRIELRANLVQRRAQAKVDQAKDYGVDARAKALSQGGFGQAIQQLRAQYDANGIPYTDAKIYAQAVEAMQGEDKFNNIMSNIQDSAATLFPAFAPDIKAGKAAKDKLAPFISLMSQAWEVPEDQIKPQDLYFVAADPAKPMDIPSFKDYLLKDPRYKKTQAYKDTAMNDFQGFARELGLE